MTTYLLTTGDDKITGTTGADTFDEFTSGKPGGTDAISGGSGADYFDLYSYKNSAGIISGGDGIDTITLKSRGSIAYLGGRTYEGIEILKHGGYIDGTIEQFSSFTEFEIPYPGSLHIYLRGNGGKINFSYMNKNGFLEVVASNLSSGGDITGTNFRDSFSGSKFDDIFNGGDGYDYFHTSNGHDILRGEGGNDKFSLRTRASAGVVDGGLGTDEVITDTSSLGTLKFIDVESLYARLSIEGSIDQFNSFKSIRGEGNYISFYLVRSGGYIDFSSLILDGRQAYVRDSGVTSGYSIIGTSKSDDLGGSAFNDTFEGGAGRDSINGMDGSDTASYTKSTAAVNVNLTTGTQTGGHAEGDYLQQIENVIGSQFSDLLTGNESANRLSGGAGNDTMAGGAGADYLSGGDGIDTVSYAGADAAVVASLANPSINTGDAAGDVYVSIENLTGSTYDDALNGDNGANTIIGNYGNDVIKGYGGRDKLFGDDGNDILLGGVGPDYLSGGTGADTASYADATESVWVILSAPEENRGIAAGDTYNSIERIVGSNFNDVLDGNSGSNILVGGNGNDSLGTGFRGRDELYGGNGDDKLFTVNETYDSGVFDGGAGVDTLESEFANLVGRTIVNVENLSIFGKVTATINILTKFLKITSEDSGPAGIELEGSGGLIDFSKSAVDGINILKSSTTSGITVIATSGLDYLQGSEFNDVLQGGAGADGIYGRAGNDTVSYSTSTAAVTVNLNLNFQDGSLGDARGDYLTGIENVIGSSFADSLTGDKGGNRLFGGDGSDFLTGGLGSDYLSGGIGIDCASYASTSTGVIVSLTDPALNTGEAKGDTYNSIENLAGSVFKDTLDGSAGANSIDGGNGNDIVSGLAGNDALYGGDGDDTLSGGAGADKLNGGVGTDTAYYKLATAGVAVNLIASSENTGEAKGDTFVSIENLSGSSFDDALTGDVADNLIQGGAGNDSIRGHKGNDTLAGNSGKDIFVFNTALSAWDNTDTITDFSRADDTIHLEKAIFTALTSTGALAPAAFRATPTGLAADADDRIIYDTDSGDLFYDADGNGAGSAIRFATLIGLPIIASTDFQVV
jgi:Ca2+-binding RTX toxin-like protein